MPAPGWMACSSRVKGATMITIDPAEPRRGGMTQVLNAAIAPRPIAWIGTAGPGDVVNVAPHSYTTVLSSDPPIVGFVSIGRKDTLRNVERTGEFVYHIAGEEMAALLNLTSADFPSEISEADWTGLTPVACERIKPCRIAEAAVAFECVDAKVIEIVPGTSWLVSGRVALVHVAEHIMTEGRIDPEKLRPIGRLGRSDFARLGPLFEMRRPTYQGLLDDGAMPVRGLRTDG